MKIKHVKQIFESRLTILKAPSNNDQDHTPSYNRYSIIGGGGSHDTVPLTEEKKSKTV